ncbi:MAG: hypothetical protein BWX79_01693 [Alphaproteobacteria bacterium ADurb.Bin100]|nr:MAG: hypothetical protein BWX79_01693 [Alphaproteobacteria bacterium ADurb.Bin100]
MVGIWRVALAQRLSPLRSTKARLPLSVAMFDAAVKNIGRPSWVSFVNTCQLVPLASSDQLEPVAQKAPPALLVKLSVLSVTFV